LVGVFFFGVAISSLMTSMYRSALISSEIGRGSKVT
jgi:hypothetical protein